MKDQLANVATIEGVRIFDVRHHADERGVFAKPVETHFVARPGKFGEIYVIHAPPGSVRGNHHHRESTEWFCVILGRALLVLEKNGIRNEIVMDGAKPITVEIPAGVAHAIKSLGPGNMTLVVYWDRGYDPAASDTYPEKIAI
jgi:dTDP-4-dehydrorhamnose 3,5-epimerase-like enzyme